MISVEEAIQTLKNLDIQPQREWMGISKAIGHVLAEDVLAPIDQPGFNQSAMDGYALNVTPEFKAYKMVGEVEAGSDASPDLKPGECVRIFTGARVPDTANTVIQQEWAIVQDDEISFDRDIQSRKNIRYQGEQIQVGEVALEKGHVLNPASIGFLTGLGITEVNVCQKPKVHILTTGNELVQPGENLKPGQIYESNSQMLKAALETVGVHEVVLDAVKDNYQETVSIINRSLIEADMLILSGGISVGEYDYVKQALKANGVEELFYKVNQKPGKPVFFGKKESKVIAALPGNPAAALTCFYIYVLPLIHQLSGKGFTGLPVSRVRIAGHVKKKGNRAQFLKAKRTGDCVQPLGGQSSAMLQSFAQANALIYLPEAVQEVEKGAEVLVYEIHKV